MLDAIIIVVVVKVSLKPLSPLKLANRIWYMVFTRQSEVKSIAMIIKLV